MNTLYIHLFNFLFQCVLCILFFRVLQPQRPVPVWRQVVAVLSLGIMLPLFISVNYVPPYNIMDTMYRFFYRAGVYVIYLKLSKDCPIKVAVYVALLFTSIYTASQAVLQVPVFFDEPTEFGENLLRNIVYIPVIYGCYKLLPPERFLRITRSRWFLLSVVIICLLYTKNSLFVLNYTGALSPDYLSVALILLHLFLLGFILAFERYAYSTHLLEQNRMQEIVNGYRMRNLKTRQEAQADLRALHHDMKHHLLAIQKLAQEGAQEQIVEYTGQLLHRSHDYERLVQTGNDLLDGLMSQKCQEAMEEDVSVDVQLDFRRVHDVSDVDICTVFGNAMDNAIEACRNVTPGSKRKIVIRTGEGGGQVFISISNPYEGNLTLKNGLPVTTKAQAYLHGFGLHNIRRTMERYGGTLNVDTSEEGRFTLNLIFPLSE